VHAAGRERLIQQTHSENGCAAQTEAEPGSRLQTHLHLRVPQINDPERSGQKEKARERGERRNGQYVGHSGRGPLPPPDEHPQTIQETLQSDIEAGNKQEPARRFTL